MFVIKEPQKLSFEKVGIKGKIFPVANLTTKTQFVLVETNTGHETTIIEYESDFSYYIVEGKGSFIVEGEEESCEKGDLVVIPAGKPFRYVGTLKMLLNSTPVWKESQEETLTKK
jgi:mannose-6-phosphate isomerase-like protein (cupin superfamily)